VSLNPFRKKVGWVAYATVSRHVYLPALWERRVRLAIVKTNKAFYDEFVQHLHENGYPSIAAFIAEQSDSKAVGVITSYLKRPAAAPLYGGLGRPYATAKARWYLLAWILRDAPVQRLEPFLNDIPGDSQEERKAALLNEVRKFIKPLLPEAEHWTWAVISEVLLAFLICQFPDQID
jgi:hypothetical protein